MSNGATGTYQHPIAESMDVIYLYDRIDPIRALFCTKQPSCSPTEFRDMLDHCVNEGVYFDRFYSFLSFLLYKKSEQRFSLHKIDLPNSYTIAICCDIVLDLITNA